MTREQKTVVIDNLTERINGTNHFYLADISTLNALDTSALRRKCHEKNIQLLVVKNTLLKQAMEKADVEYDELFGVLKDSTSIITKVDSNSVVNEKVNPLCSSLIF